MWVWRLAAAATTGTPVVAAMVSCLWIMQDLDLTMSVSRVFVHIYLVTRLALVVEMFRGLAYLPTEMFIATWTANVPHIG